MDRRRHTEVKHYDDATEVGKRLRQAREQAGLSQRQLSFPGCSPAYLSRIEAGDRAPSLQLMRELAKRLEVSEDYLAWGKESADRLDPLLEAEVAMRLDDRDRAAELFTDGLASEDASRRAAALEGLGQLAFRSGDLRAAIDLLEQALEGYGEKALERTGLAATLGRAYAFAGDLESAIAVFQRSYDAAVEREDVLDQVRFAVYLSAALTDAGRFAQAEEVISSALTHVDALADPLARVRLYWAQMRLHALNNRPELAARYGHKVIDLLELTEDSYHLARAYRLLASIELDRDRAPEALELLEKAKAVVSETGNEAEEATNRLVEARALAELGQLEEAASLAMSLTQALTDRPEETGRSYHLLAGVFAKAGDRPRAIELYELAAEFLERTPNRFLVETYAQLADLLESEGKTQEALDLMKKAVGIRTETAKTTRPAD